MLQPEIETAFVNRALQGDGESFAALVTAYTAPLYNIAFKMIGSASEAEDIVQESFMRAYGSLNKFEKGRRFYSWLYAICLNVTRDYLRRRDSAAAAGFFGTSASHEASASIPSDLPAPHEALIQEERREALRSAVLQLPTEQREALVLRYFQELPFAEVAQICEITENAAKKRVYQALFKLSEILTASEDQR